MLLGLGVRYDVIYFSRASGDLSPADNHRKKLRPRSGPTFCKALSGFKLFDTLMAFPKIFWKSNN